MAENTTVENTGQMQILSRASKALNEHPNLGLGCNLDEKTSSSTGSCTCGTLLILNLLYSKTQISCSVSDKV